MAAAPVLTILKNGETVKSCPLEGEAMLGRAEGCVIRLEDRAISREHAMFKVVDGGVQVERRSEFAPLSVNGIEATRAIVKDADVIAIGPYLVKVSVPKIAPQSQHTKTPAPVIPLAPLTAATSQLLSPDAAPFDLGPEAGEVDGAGLLPDLGEAQAQMESVLDAEAPGAEGDEFLSDPAEPLEGEPGADGDQAFNVIEGVVADALPGMGDGAALGVEGVDVPGALPGLNPEVQPGFAPDESIEVADDDAKTKLTPLGKLSVFLVFPPGAANVTDFELTQDEIYIGRGKGCEIVINDKKASRKNTVIRRAGMNFSVKDLDSANGTYVNGLKITEQELSSEDVIRIGAIEFTFVAKSADYSKKIQGFMPVSNDPVEAPVADNGFGGDGDPFAQVPELPGQGHIPVPPPFNGPPGGIAPEIPGIVGIGPPDYKKMSLFEKFRNFKDLPRRQQIVLAVIAIGLAYFIFLDDVDDEPAKKKAGKPKQGVVATSGPTLKASPTFESLTPEQQRAIENWYNLAFDYYKNREYDSALNELNKIFGLVNDYKEARNIERYAREGKRKLEAMEEEKRRKEEEAALKAKVEALVSECGERMKSKQYEQAKELFTQITLIDPDNAQVAAWRKEIEQAEEDARAAEQTRQVQEEINKRAWEVYQEGLGLKKRGKYHSAIDVFSKVPDIGASDPRPVELSRKEIRRCLELIKSLRDPVLAEAKVAEDAMEFPKAFALYKKATRIDPPHPAGWAGMARIRGILHDQARTVYAEAVLLESFSDFATARKKYKECLEIAPVDDIYHERAIRKLARFFKREEASTQ